MGMEEWGQRTEPGKEWVKGSLGLDRKLWGGERPPPGTLLCTPLSACWMLPPKCNSYFLDEAGYLVSILIKTFSITFCFVRCCTLSSWNCAKYTPWLMTCNHPWSLLSPSYLRYLVTLHNKHCQANLTQVLKMKKKKMYQWYTPICVLTCYHLTFQPASYRQLIPWICI